MMFRTGSYVKTSSSEEEKGVSDDNEVLSKTRQPFFYNKFINLNLETRREDGETSVRTGNSLTSFRHGEGRGASVRDVVGAIKDGGTVSPTTIIISSNTNQQHTVTRNQKKGGKIGQNHKGKRVQIRVTVRSVRDYSKGFETWHGAKRAVRHKIVDVPNK